MSACVCECTCMARDRVKTTQMAEISCILKTHNKTAQEIDIVYARRLFSSVERKRSETLI